jgi:hypothetical protein
MDDACPAIVSCVTQHNAFVDLNKVPPSPLEMRRAFSAIVEHQILC